MKLLIASLLSVLVLIGCDDSYFKKSRWEILRDCEDKDTYHQIFMDCSKTTDMSDHFCMEYAHSIACPEVERYLEGHTGRKW